MYVSVMYLDGHFWNKSTDLGEIVLGYLKPQQVFINLPLRTFLRCWSILGCQMACFQTKNPNFGTFLRALE
jgi:hypothetical protein